MEVLEERRADRYLARIPRRRLAALLALGVILGTVCGYALSLRVRPGTAGRAGGAYATAECTSAVARANATIAWAVRTGRAFAEQTSVMSQLARHEIGVEGAVQADRAPAADGAAATSKFNDALADYLRVVDACQPESG